MADKNSETEAAAVDAVAERLVAKNPQINQAYIRELVHNEYETLRSARLRDYIPVLVEHAVKQDLKAEKAKRSTELL